MSFSSKAKEDLTKLQPRRRCCRTALLSALLQTAGSIQISGKEIKARLVTESNAVARFGIALAKSIFQLESEIFVKEKSNLGRLRNFEILLFGANAEYMLHATGVLIGIGGGHEFGCGMPTELDRNECCKRAFLKGAFLGGGSMSNPQKGYHLEFVLSSEGLAAYLCELLNSYHLNAKVVIRNGTNVIYLKESDKITDFLALVSANTAILELQNIKAYKDFRNNLNRKVNCETANLQKTVSASVRQIENIRFLINELGLERIPEPLREIAEVRVNNPDSSLQELSALLSQQLGKSGVNHRLRKLEAMAFELKSHI